MLDVNRLDLGLMCDVMMTEVDEFSPLRWPVTVGYISCKVGITVRFEEIGDNGSRCLVVSGSEEQYVVWGMLQVADKAL